MLRAQKVYRFAVTASLLVPFGTGRGIVTITNYLKFMKKTKRGFALMSKVRLSRVGQMGGRKSPTKFKKGEKRTMIAAEKGGAARAKDPFVKSGKMGILGAKARWGKKS